MTKEQFAKYHYRHSEIITCNPYTSETMKHIKIDCLLMGVDFEQGLFKLLPLNTEEYEETPFWARYEYCIKPIKSLKIVKS